MLNPRFDKSFAAQKRAALYVGMSFLALGITVFLTAGETAVFNLLLAVAGVFLIFGYVVRSLHRWNWLQYFAKEKSDLGQATFRIMIDAPLFGAFWRWWLHVDQEGRDLDAQN